MANEILYNGIELPTEWPPRIPDDGSQEPAVPPYLQNPPALIRIDVGRQLLVDDFLIESTTLSRSFGKPQIYPQSPVLTPEAKEEMDDGNCPVAAFTSTRAQL